jgi:drug/metabolite transporter (DMT)-like permease
MSTTVMVAVLFAALLHASWNAVVKGGHDKLLSTSAVAIGHALPAVVAIALLPAPARESWPWIALGGVLHIGYQAFLAAAYRLGDLAQVYPLARGSAPLIVALVSVTVLGVALSTTEVAAILLIAAGIIAIGADRSGRPDPMAVTMALTTGGFIAAYSLSDGTGARLSGSPVAFYSWVAILNATMTSCIVAIYRPGALLSLPRRAPGAFWFGGLASYSAYALVVWSFTLAPIALVTALRETSIIFALVIGAVFLREKVDLRRTAATFVTLSGVLLLRLGRS